MIAYENPKKNSIYDQRDRIMVTHRFMNQIDAKRRYQPANNFPIRRCMDYFQKYKLKCKPIKHTLRNTQFIQRTFLLVERIHKHDGALK